MEDKNIKKAENNMIKDLYERKYINIFQEYQQEDIESKMIYSSNYKGKDYMKEFIAIYKMVLSDNRNK